MFAGTVTELVLNQVGTDGLVHFSTFSVIPSWDDSKGRS